MSYLFHGQRSDEEVLLLTKQHPFVLFHPLLIAVFLLWIPLVAYIFLYLNTTLLVISLLSLGAAGLHAALAWYKWNNSLLLLTNQRVVVLQQRNWLHREFTECSLASIQKVSHEVKGLFHTLLGYGTIALYTGGGGDTVLLLPSVPGPYDIQQEILRAAQGSEFVPEEEVHD